MIRQTPRLDIRKKFDLVSAEGLLAGSAVAVESGGLVVDLVDGCQWTQVHDLHKNEKTLFTGIPTINELGLLTLICVWKL